MDGPFGTRGATEWSPQRPGRHEIVDVLAQRWEQATVQGRMDPV